MHLRTTSWYSWYICSVFGVDLRVVMITSNIHIDIWLDRGLEKSYNKTHVIFGMLMMRCHSNDESIEAVETLSFFKQDSVEMIFIVVEIGSGVYIRMTTPKDILYNKNNNNNKEKEKEKDSFFQAIEFSRLN